MKTELTIIIPFLNEGVEIEKTIQSIVETTETNPKIILINDNSYDEYDYQPIVNQYKKDITYVYHTERLGVAASRNEGVEMCQTPYFLLLDGHMRFYESGWDKRLVQLLKKYPGCLLCGQTRVLKKDEKRNITANDKLKHYGAYIDLKNLTVRWNDHDSSPDSNIMEIPCVLGAAYAMEKSYWLYLHGLNGLRSYGMDEQLLSLKVWLEGGRCLLIKDLVVGHIYRETFPYNNPSTDYLDNKLYIAQLLFPFSLKQKMFEQFKYESGETFSQVYQELKDRYSSLKEEQNYLQTIFRCSVKSFVTRNNMLASKRKNVAT